MQSLDSETADFQKIAKEIIELRGGYSQTAIAVCTSRVEGKTSNPDDYR